MGPNDKRERHGWGVVFPVSIISFGCFKSWENKNLKTICESFENRVTWQVVVQPVDPSNTTQHNTTEVIWCSLAYESYDQMKKDDQT